MLLYQTQIEQEHDNHTGKGHYSSFYSLFCNSNSYNFLGFRQLIELWHTQVSNIYLHLWKVPLKSERVQLGDLLNMYTQNESTILQEKKQPCCLQKQSVHAVFETRNNYGNFSMQKVHQTCSEVPLVDNFRAKRIIRCNGSPKA